MTVAPAPEITPDAGSMVSVGGVDTWVHDLGAGAPVMLLHGSGPGVSAFANWRLTMPALVAAGNRVIAPDQLGFGQTVPPAGHDYGLDSWVEHAIGVLDALGLERVGLVGNSFGGAVALALASRHPERVERLVLMGSVGVEFELTPGLDAVWGYEPSVEAMHELLRIFAYDQSLVSGDLAKIRYEASIADGAQDRFGAMFPAPRQRWVTAMATPEEQIRAVSQPALIVHGRDDQVIPLETSLRLHQLLDDSELHVFGRCGHWTQIERTAQFNALLTRFFAQTS
ncbi:alpha/beta fold hydrolase [Ornithinimicrobium cryptoxanthini]|nr:alpha/beta fold hydrolase [Ornithinimicrobium cryptoxanthini]